MAIKPRRFSTRGRGSGARIVWQASGPARVRIEVERQVHRSTYRRVTTLTRSVGSGSGAMRFPARAPGHRLRAGLYRLRLGSTAAAIRFERRYLKFRVT
jgi:hypothetical protein